MDLKLYQFPEAQSDTAFAPSMVGDEGEPRHFRSRVIAVSSGK